MEFNSLELYGPVGSHVRGAQHELLDQKYLVKAQWMNFRFSTLPLLEEEIVRLWGCLKPIQPSHGYVSLFFDITIGEKSKTRDGLFPRLPSPVSFL